MGDIALALQGFGAGVAGRGGEFTQGLERNRILAEQQEAEQQQQRHTMMLMDNRVYLDHMKNGRFDKGRELLVNRISSINQLGGDPRHSQGLLDIMNTGDNQLALSESQIFDDAAVTRKLLDPMGGDEEKRTSLMKNLQASGLEPGSPEFQQAMREQLDKPAGTTVTIGGEAEGHERKELAKVMARRFEKLTTDADNAESIIANLDQLDAVGVKTGALEPAKASLAAVMEGFGLDASGVADVTTSQALGAVSNRMVNTVLNAAKGPQTEGDANRARKTIKSLGDDPLAGQFKSDSLRAISLRTIEQREFIEGMIDGGATFSKSRAAWNKFKKQTPSLSAVVKNPQTGLPVFFYQFKQNASRARPGITDKEIIEAWRGAHAGK